MVSCYDCRCLDYNKYKKYITYITDEPQVTGCEMYIVFIWLRKSTIKTKSFVRGLFVPELNIVGGAVSLTQQLPI